MERWTGVLEWSAGLECWTEVLNTRVYWSGPEIAVGTLGVETTMPQQKAASSWAHIYTNAFAQTKMGTRLGTQVK